MLQFTHRYPFLSAICYTTGADIFYTTQTVVCCTTLRQVYYLCFTTYSRVMLHNRNSINFLYIDYVLKFAVSLKWEHDRYVQNIFFLQADYIEIANNLKMKSNFTCYPFWIFLWQRNCLYITCNLMEILSLSNLMLSPYCGNFQEWIFL